MYLYGANGHGKVVMEIAELSQFVIKGFIDQNKEIIRVLDYKVYHELPENIENLFISIGNNIIRKRLYEKYIYLNYPILIHPKSVVSNYSNVDIGSVIMASATINPMVNIGKLAIINTNASIDHDCQIGDYVHISPNASLAGNVTVGEGTHIGIGASVIQNIKIGKWCTIGAGAVIIHDVPDGATVVGNPGRIIKSNQTKTKRKL